MSSLKEIIQLIITVDVIQLGELWIWCRHFAVGDILNSEVVSLSGFGIVFCGFGTLIDFSLKKKKC